MKPHVGENVFQQTEVRARAYSVVRCVPMNDHWSGEQKRDEREGWEVRKMGDGS